MSVAHSQLRLTVSDSHQFRKKSWPEVSRRISAPAQSGRHSLSDLHRDASLRDKLPRPAKKTSEVVLDVDEKVSLSSMDMTIFGEAHGMITDLLADSSLPPNVVGTLRIVADMMSPLLQHGFHRSSLSNSLVTVQEKSQVQEDEQQVMNQPDLKDDTPLSLKQRLHRNLGVSSRRMSSSYTTTTSATGMPSFDMEYRTKKVSTQRSNVKSPSSRSKSYAGSVVNTEVRRVFASKSHSFSQAGAPPLRADKGKASEDDIFKVEITRGKPVYFEGMESGSDSDELPEDVADASSVELPSSALGEALLNRLRSLEAAEDSDCSSHGQGNEHEPEDSSRRNTVDSDVESAEVALDGAKPESLVDRTQVTNSLEAIGRRLSHPFHAPSYLFDDAFRRASSPNLEASSSRPSVDSPTISVSDLGLESIKSLDSKNRLLGDLCSDGLSQASEADSSFSRKYTPAETRVNPPLAQRPVANLNIAQVAPVPKTSADDTKPGRSPRDSLTIPTNLQQRRRSSRELHLEYETAVSEEINLILSNLNDWNFPIFELSEKCNILTQLAFRIFQVCGFFTTFKIPEITFLKYFRALESGYHEIPCILFLQFRELSSSDDGLAVDPDPPLSRLDHNRIHAADVLHGVYFLTQHKIPGFSHTLSRRSSLNLDNDSTQESVTDDEQDLTYGCISQAIPELELMALYTAAAMHDFDHPGRTNAFLVATLNPKALLYNDRSVLENHHAAASWSLLVSNPGMNFLSHLDPSEFKRFRFIVIEEILSTDLKKHFDFMTEWNAKISDQGGGINFAIEADRLLVGQMAIKLADISGPSKVWELHNLWTTRIVEEFYQQGDDERALEMPISPYMDRRCPKVAQLQSSFIKHLVCPLYLAYEKAGILPGQWVDQEVNEEENDDDESAAVGANQASDISDDSSDVGESFDCRPAQRRKRKVPFSPLMDSIQKNHERWLKVIEEEETNAVVNGESGASEPTPTAMQPATIKEDVEAEAVVERNQASPDAIRCEQSPLKSEVSARKDDRAMRKNARCESSNVSVAGKKS